MQVINYTDEHVGSLDWELPEDLAANLDALPNQLRRVVLGEIEIQIHAFMLMLLGAVQSGPKASDALRTIAESNEKTARALMTTITRR